MRSKDRLLVGMVGALLVAPVVLELAFGGAEVPFRYSAADAFYYHTVARNLARTGVATFDLEHPTNGFHPLWQVMLAGQYWLVDALGGSELTYLVVSTLSCLGLVTLAVAVLGRAVFAARGSVPVLFGLLPTGAYALFLAPVWMLAVDGMGVVTDAEGRLPLYGTLWSFVNGMESSLVLCLFGALALAVATDASATRVGLLSALVALARLDHVFISGAVSAWWLMRGTRSQGRTAFALGIAFASPLLLYAAVNLWYAGALLPVSGAAKSSFPHLGPIASENLRAIFELWTQPFDGRGLIRFFRLAQIWIPATTILVYAVSFLRRRPDRWQGFLLAAGAGALVLATYNFCFVDLAESGHWYYPVSTLLVTLIVMDVARLRVPIAVLAMVSIAAFTLLHRRLDYHERYSHFYLVEAPALRAHYGTTPPKVVELDDGIFAFATGFPTMSGFGFMLDVEAYRALRRGELGRLAMDRGFDRLATVAYREPREMGLTATTPPELLPRYVAGLMRGLRPVGRLEVTLDYLSPSGRCAVLRRWRDPPATADPRPGAPMRR
jgi:hypothetical protein